jgi:hypothetical protein
VKKSPAQTRIVINEPYLAANGKVSSLLNKGFTAILLKVRENNVKIRFSIFRFVDFCDPGFCRWSRKTDYIDK